MESGIGIADERRRGPSPFPVHAALAFREYARLCEEGRDPPRLQKMLEGIRQYLSHPWKREMGALPCVWQRGQARLLYCAAIIKNKREKPRGRVFLVPSLVNGSEIFDLLPEKSFVRWLSCRGIESYLLDWGDPAADQGARNMDSLVTDRLCAAIGEAAKMAGGKIHALGYCMGGTLLAAAGMQKRDALKSAIFLATPWDFHAGDAKLSREAERGFSIAAEAIARKGVLPVCWIQSVFAAINAERAMQKFIKFADMDKDGAPARLFVATEDWLNNGTDMPAAVARECILGWYRDNKPARGLWSVAGVTVAPSFLNIPSLVVASEGDRLVPRESTLALAKDLPRATLLTPSCGHIGMMTGGSAAAQLWEPLAAWIAENP